MFPIHKGIFDYLKKIVSDGTFDQLAPIDRLIEGPEYRSYDLSAATDRIPLECQRQVLALFSSQRIADL